MKREVQAFADVNTAWLTGVLGGTAEAGRQALAIFAALAGAQLIARSRSDIKMFDAVVESYRAAGLIPA